MPRRCFTLLSNISLDLVAERPLRGTRTPCYSKSGPRIAARLPIRQPAASEAALFPRDAPDRVPRELNGKTWIHFLLPGPSGRQVFRRTDRSSLDDPRSPRRPHLRSPFQKRTRPVLCPYASSSTMMMICYNATTHANTTNILGTSLVSFRQGRPREIRLRSPSGSLLE